MKTCFKNLFLPAALMAGLSSPSAGRVTAQTFTTLHNFAGYPSDGAGPQAGLILSDNTLYGTTVYGGSLGVDGTVFAVNADGTGFRTVHSFTGGTGGGEPIAGLILSGNTLYGTAAYYGSSGAGAVFAVNTDGTGFRTLHNFTKTSGLIQTNSDGAMPSAGLILSGNTLYGTAYIGGSLSYGTVFALNTDGTGFTNLHSFTGGSDGADPRAGLILSDNTLYGTAQYGGSSGAGTVFALNTDGTGFRTLHSFIGNGGEAEPFAGLILSGSTLYGTAQRGGNPGVGTVFAVNTDGTGFTNLHSFTGSDGTYPTAGLILSGNILYGTAQQGGSGNSGTVFALNTNGTGFTILYNFTAASGPSPSTNSDGANPFGVFVISGNTLYGTALLGGRSGNGTLFSLSLEAPQVTVIPSGAHVILTWPTNAAGFTLQSSTNLVSPALWTAVAPGPVVINGENAVTNLISGTHQFYRLSQ